MALSQAGGPHLAVHEEAVLPALLNSHAVTPGGTAAAAAAGECGVLSIISTSRHCSTESNKPIVHNLSPHTSMPRQELCMYSPHMCCWRQGPCPPTPSPPSTAAPYPDKAKHKLCLPTHLCRYCAMSSPMPVPASPAPRKSTLCSLKGLPVARAEDSRPARVMQAVP
jgi:hypothetical protein